MPTRSSIDPRVAVRVLRDVDKEIKRAIAVDSKRLGAGLLAALRADPGVSPYSRVYAKLGAAARVRTRSGRPPEIVIGGARRFSGGATISELVRPYEYGALTGDTKRGRGSTTLTDAQRGGRHRRHRGRRPLPQFPPQANAGMWANAVCERYEKGPLIDEWLTIIDAALARAAG